MKSLNVRLWTIVALLGISAWALWPRDTIERRRGPDGSFIDNADGSFQFDTVKRIPLKRGLDLQGGMHLTLELDESKGAIQDKSAALDKALTVIRNRIDEFGVTEPVIQKVGDDRIIVELPGVDDPERAIRVVQRSAFLEFKIVDETGALERAMARIDRAASETQIAASVATPDSVGRAAQPSGLTGLFGADTSRRDSTARDTAAVAGTGRTPVSSLLQQGQMPGQYFVRLQDGALLSRYLAAPEVAAVLPAGKELHWGSDTLVIGQERYRALYMLDQEPILTGEQIVDAKPMQDPMEGTLVTFQLTNAGGTQFRRETGRHIKDYLATVLDDRVVSSPAVIQSAISTRGQITMGNRGDLEGAQEFALVLRSGALPAPLKIGEMRNIGPSLGQDSVEQGIRAGLLGLALVVLIMVGYYRLSGLMAVAGLAFYAITTLAFLAAFGAALTLPGIAGFILSIGMAVDANFLQFERIREELDAGHTTRRAVDEGFSNSFAAIIDTHMTTAITAAILYQFGTGPVRGFAVTLLAGVASSMVSSVFVVRTLFLVWLKRTAGAKPLSI